MTDPTIDEVRKARRKISAEIGPQLSGLVDRYEEMGSRFKRAPLTPKERRTIRCTKAAERQSPTVETSPPPLGDR